MRDTPAKNDFHRILTQYRPLGHEEDELSTSLRAAFTVVQRELVRSEEFRLALDKHDVRVKIPTVMLFISRVIAPKCNTPKEAIRTELSKSAIANC